MENPEELLVFEYVALPLRLVEEERELLMCLAKEDLPEDCQAWSWSSSTQALGTRWMREARSAVLEVLSAVVPHERNYLVNSQHSHFEELEIGALEVFPVHPRLVRG